MAIKITPHLVTLTYEAALKSFWRKPALRKFLLSSHLSPTFVAGWAADESKRLFLDRVFENLQKTDRGKSVIGQMALALSEQKSFPDLVGWEDSDQKIVAAQKAVSDLSDYIRRQQDEISKERETATYIKQIRAERENASQSAMDKKKLEERLNQLLLKAGTQQAGYDFEDWFYDMLEFGEIVCRRPYKTDGRQIDGSLTLEGTTYLVELKFTREQSGSPDIDTFKAKVESKADNTMGVMISISSYSSIAIKEGSGRKTTLLLFDCQHLFHFLTGHMGFDEIILRVRRHAAQTGESYLPPQSF